MEQKYWILLGLLAVYFFMHSLFAAKWIKSLFEELGMSSANYRKVYILIALLGLLAIMFYVATLSEKYLFQPGEIVKFVSLVFAASGTIVIHLAFKQYRLKEFLGLKNENPSGKLIVKGILSYIRHPLYTGTILIVIGYLLYVPKISSAIISVIIVLYILIGIKLEEKKLEMEFGESYIEYKKKVPGLIPKIRELISF